MIRKQPKQWETLLTDSLQQLIAKKPMKFSEMIPSSLPDKAGVYLITKIEGNSETPYYVGRTKNIGQRLYNNHLMGSLSPQ